MLVPQPATDGEPETVGQHSGLVDLCKWREVDPRRQDSSNISGLCPPPPPSPQLKVRLPHGPTTGGTAFSQMLGPLILTSRCALNRNHYKPNARMCRLRAGVSLTMSVLVTANLTCLRPPRFFTMPTTLHNPRLP